MKKHLVLTFLFTLAAVTAALAQAQTFALASSPSNVVQKIRETAEQSLGISNTRNGEKDRDHGDCDKCHKRKKGKKHNECKQRGHHYGKHKNRHDCHSCSCDHRGDGHDRRKRDCDDDRRCDRNSRDWEYDDRGHGRNRGDRDDDQRYGSNDRGRDEEYRQQPRTTQRTPSAKVKTRPGPSAKPAPSRPVAQKKTVARPVGSRN
ncbi:MAG: hypothetical protein EPGJADBJ_02916 [Saprospiraceae bacterium]|nr:hypothetical protein [Saprospiraceae bacterium]